ncbi:single-stranded DNA-binding protein [Micrococcales bacterium 31B]|nr:single-stranded DNA-binding protein [Micrococcales bacterium 31B]
MAGETLITVVGNLTGDPELRFTQSGAAVASFTVASTPRTFDRQSNEWKDGEALFLRCSVWREMAENVAESLTKGMRVVVQGNLKQRSWQDRDGQNRTSVELDVVEVGPSLFRASAKVTRNQRSGGGNFGGAPSSQGYQANANQGGYNNAPAPAGNQGGFDNQAAPQRGYNNSPSADDPWASRDQGASYSDAPPF